MVASHQFNAKWKLVAYVSYEREDIWHLNEVTAPEPLGSSEAHGRWVLPLKLDEMTKAWHTIEHSIENKDKKFGIVRMVCPSNQDHEVYTSLWVRS